MPLEQEDEATIADSYPPVPPPAEQKQTQTNDVDEMARENPDDHVSDK